MKRNIRFFLKQCFQLLVMAFLMIGLSMIFKETFSWLAWVVPLLLYLLSTPPIALLLIRGVERIPVVTPEACKEADAIIVLGAGSPKFSPEFDEFQPTAFSLERIRYTAILHRQCGVPILATGGGDRPEAETMARVLQSDYGIETKWLERESLTTWQNALYSRALLDDEQGKVVIVTHAVHMARAVLSFERAGFEKVIPAPTAFYGREIRWRRLSNWLPTVRNLQMSETALHEYLGFIWYWLTSR